jgi:hypothetical protein
VCVSDPYNNLFILHLDNCRDLIYVYVMGRLSEVQLLVLLSFILQLFLFFTGGLRRRRRNWLVRGTIWIAYLGADVVAIYALGFLSRHADAMMESSSSRLAHPLAFLWAPFLLIHLGGQDSLCHRGQQPVAAASAQPATPSDSSTICVLEVQ